MHDTQLAPRQCAALLISAPASGQGKTTVTAALARYYRQQGKRVRVFKTGPDFIDPMIHQVASGEAVYQLDVWMGGETHCRQLLYLAAFTSDIILIEGVMGLFDGEPSSADLARLFGLPILAVIDGQSMAQTLAAVAYGLAHYQADLPFLGIFANRVSGQSHYEWLTQNLRPSTPALGWMNKQTDITLSERHLGLVQAEEIEQLDKKIDRMVEQLHITNLELPSVVFYADKSSKQIPVFAPLQGQRIAIARDAAFSFIYQANIDFLQQMGAQIEFFSPISDSQLPQADALYFPGGYPELHLDKLAKNHSMIDAITAFHHRQCPILAECGGMMYLGNKITHQQQSAKMVGLLQAEYVMQPKLVHLGMHSAAFAEGELRGHSFHYADITTDETPFITSQPARAKRPSEAIYRHQGLTASFIHWYFPSNPQAAIALFKT